MSLMRIQKYISQQGWLSRRKAEEAMQNGHVKVNGEVVKELGTKINPEKDKVELDESILNKKYIYLAVYKPKKMVTNLPQNDEIEVRNFLPEEYKHLNAVGRLDKDSEGLILFTDDGIFSKHFLDPKVSHKRLYEIKVNKDLDATMIEQLEDEMLLDGYLLKPTKVERLSHKHFTIELTEGKNRQIRRMIEEVGSYVVMLKRLKFGPYDIGDLESGDYKEVSNLI
ncbi:rRNA pseudouridine synthase [Candidatus Marinamargulisbacteria bacterium SCGC AAA071-K20]|nr:rRNA pseudouridine synthase [Candidatus Marinamargulisbacteria bacterium SCGC AAA071-K20]